MADIKGSFTRREATLILYKAAELQDNTWWLRSVRLAQREFDASDDFDLNALTRMGSRMGMDEKRIEEAAIIVAGQADKWDAT